MIDKAIVIHKQHDSKSLRTRVDAARARLAELEAAYTIDKAKVDSLHANLFKRLRPFYQERDRIRLILSCRRPFFEALRRQGKE